MTAIANLINYSGDLHSLSLVLEQYNICRLGIEEINVKDFFFSNPSSMFTQYETTDSVRSTNPNYHTTERVKLSHYSKALSHEFKSDK